MKINKRNYKHWGYLAAFTFNIIIALVVRPFKKKEALAILYGHKLNGNLKAIYDYHKSRINPTIELVYLTMDPKYHHELETQGIDTICGMSFAGARAISSAKCIVSDHGLHTLELALYFSDIKFVDVWHGLPFKGFDKLDFRTIRNFDETWVTSRLIKELYTNKFGFKKNTILVTGYARTDLLLRKTKSRSEILDRVGLANHTKSIIMFAPTWQQDDQNRSLFPFNLDKDSFLSALNSIANKCNSYVVVRTHLNSSVELASEFENLITLPANRHENTEELLYITDLLICDWSSIAFDFMLLNRPTLFLNTPAPFSKGFSLGPEYRYGRIINNIEQLCFYTPIYINQPELYMTEFSQFQSEVIGKLYDSTADGHSSERCYTRLERICR